jgi:hypothetical protein
MVRVRLGEMPLRIVVWNCNGALHRKWERLLALRPDVAVVAESAHPEILRRKAPRFAFAYCEWDGWNRDQGLAVFSFGECALERTAQESKYQIFMPLQVRGPHPFHLLAVWAFSVMAPFRAITNSPSIRAALAHYTPFLSSAPSVVAGDFNSSPIWDRPGERSNHAESVADLRERGLESAYHLSTGCSPGAECDATLFHGRKIESRYHID